MTWLYLLEYHLRFVVIHDLTKLESRICEKQPGSPSAESSTILNTDFAFEVVIIDENRGEYIGDSRRKYFPLHLSIAVIRGQQGKSMQQRIRLADSVREYAGVLQHHVGCLKIDKAKSFSE
jgi:hypothetical protein